MNTHFSRPNMRPTVEDENGIIHWAFDGYQVIDPNTAQTYFHVTCAGQQLNYFIKVSDAYVEGRQPTCLNCITGIQGVQENPYYNPCMEVRLGQGVLGSLTDKALSYSVSDLHPMPSLRIDLTGCNMRSAEGPDDPK